MRKILKLKKLIFILIIYQLKFIEKLSAAAEKVASLKTHQR
jgi:hypothetical protein